MAAGSTSASPPVVDGDPHSAVGSPGQRLARHPNPGRGPGPEDAERACQMALARLEPPILLAELLGQLVELPQGLLHRVGDEVHREVVRRVEQRGRGAAGIPHSGVLTHLRACGDATQGVLLRHVIELVPLVVRPVLPRVGHPVNEKNPSFTLFVGPVTGPPSEIPELASRLGERLM